MTELFRHPLLLAWLAAAFAALVWFRARAEETRRALARRVLGPQADAFAAGPAAARRTLRDWLLLAALALAGAAAAGPQWGVELTPVSDLRGNIVVAVDTSLSMAARDLKPSRLENARLLLGSVSEQFADYRIGVVAFAGQAYVQCPLTTDQEAVNYFASALSPGMLPSQGTDFPAAIGTVLGMLQRYGGQKVMVMITDGESHSKELDAALDAAAEQNLKIFTVGLGTPDGELIPVTDSLGNTLEYKKGPDGKTVVSRLDEATLIKVASRTGAAYLRYTGPDEAALAIRKAIDGLDLEKTRGRGRANYKNRYQWPLALAVLLLLIELTLMEKGLSLAFRFPRPKFFGGAALLLALLAAQAGAAGPEALARKGNKAYDSENWPKAYEYYSRAAQAAPADQRLNYNLGAAFYKLEDYGKAKEAFEASAAAKGLGAKGRFNAGNALFKSGDLPGAVAAYRAALKADPEDENAKFNLQLALAKQQENKNQCKDPKEDKDKEKNKGGGDGKDKNKSGGEGDKDKGQQDAKNQQEKRKAEARERAKQILEMMKEKEKDASRGAQAALQAMQKERRQEPPKEEDW